MPIQILPRTPGFGEQLGAGLGTGLGRGMESLMQLKMKQLAEQQQMAPFLSMVQQMYGVGGISPTETVAPPTEAAAPLTAQQVRPKTIEDLSASELARAMATAPEKVRRSLTPILDVKKGEEKIGTQRAIDYEKKIKPVVDNSIRFLTAARQAEEFAKENPDIFGPKERFIPSIDSLRQERDSHIATLVNLALSMEGSIGRGSNLMIQLKKAAKPSASMSPKEFLSILNNQKEIFGAPIKEYEDYIKMSRGKKPPEDFLGQLADRSIERYRKTGANVKKIDEAVLEESLGKPAGLPSVSQYQKGDKLRNKETGQIEYEHTGSVWRKL